MPGNNNSYVLSGQVGSEVTKTTTYDDPYWDTTPNTVYDQTVSLNTGTMNAVGVTMD